MRCEKSIGLAQKSVDHRGIKIVNLISSGQAEKMAWSSIDVNKKMQTQPIHTSPNVVNENMIKPIEKVVSLDLLFCTVFTIYYDHCRRTVRFLAAA